MLEQRIQRAAGPDELLFPALRAEYLRQPGKSPVVDGVKTKLKWWERALDAAGVEWMTPHDLRHTAASLAVSAGASVKAVQTMLGHKSAAMTLDVYSDLFDSDLYDVAARMNAQQDRVLAAHDLNTDGGDVPGILGIVRDGDSGRG